MYMYFLNIIIIKFLLVYCNVILIIIVIDFFFLIDEFSKEILLECRIGFILLLLVLEDKLDMDEGEDDYVEFVRLVFEVRDLILKG